MPHLCGEKLGAETALAVALGEDDVPKVGFETRDRVTGRGCGFREPGCQRLHGRIGRSGGDRLFPCTGGRPGTDDTCRVRPR